MYSGLPFCMARKNICSTSYSALVSVISIKLSELETSKTLQPFEITNPESPQFFKLAVAV